MNETEKQKLLPQAIRDKFHVTEANNGWDWLVRCPLTRPSARPPMWRLPKPLDSSTDARNDTSRRVRTAVKTASRSAC